MRSGWCELTGRSTVIPSSPKPTASAICSPTVSASPKISAFLSMSITASFQPLTLVRILSHHPKCLPLALSPDHDRNPGDGRRRADRIVHRLVFALETRPFASRHRNYDLKGFLESLESFGQASKLKSKGARFQLEPACPDSQRGTTARDVIERGDRLLSGVQAASMRPDRPTSSRDWPTPASLPLLLIPSRLPTAQSSRRRHPPRQARPGYPRRAPALALIPTSNERTS